MAESAMNQRALGGTVIGIGVTLGLFLLSGLMMREYGLEIERVIDRSGFWGPIIFILAGIVSVAVPVTSNLFLLPIASSIWGPLITALLCILGWFLGSVISFGIGRYAQGYFLNKFPSFYKYQYIDKLVPEKNPFFTLILLRMSFPVDVLSYGLALFSRQIGWKQNAITTLIGISPFAFVFSYVGKMSLEQQVLIFGGTATIFFIYYYLRHKKLSV